MGIDAVLAGYWSSQPNRTWDGRNRVIGTSEPVLQPFPRNRDPLVLIIQIFDSYPGSLAARSAAVRRRVGQFAQQWPAGPGVLDSRGWIQRLRPVGIRRFRGGCEVLDSR